MTSPTRRRPYRLFPAPLATTLASPMQTILRKRGFDHPALLHYWGEAVGEAFAPYAQPLSLSGKKGAAHTVLTVKVHPAYATLFAHEAEAILHRLTQHLGYRPATRIVIMQ